MCIRDSPHSQQKPLLGDTPTRRHETTFGIDGGPPVTSLREQPENPFGRQDKGHDLEQQRDEEFLKALQKIGQITPKIVDLPTFGDGKLTITQFLNQFRRAADINGWSEQQMVSILPSCLVRRALLFYNTLDDGSRRPYATLVQRLKDQFHTPESQMECRNVLYTQKQGETPLVEYLEFIEGLFEELGTPDVSKIDILIANLNPTLSYHLQTRQPRTYHEAVKLVQLRDKIQPPREDNPTMKRILEQLENLSVNKREVTNNEVDVAALLRNNRRLQQQLREARSRGYGANAPHSTNQLYHRSKQGIQCYNCGKNRFFEWLEKLVNVSESSASLDSIAWQTM